MLSRVIDRCPRGRGDRMRQRTVSASGQARRFRDVRGMSGLPPTADISGQGRHFAFVPVAVLRRLSSGLLIDA